MFENTAYCDGADCPCLAGSPRARDNRTSERRSPRPSGGGPAYTRYSPDFYDFQNNRPSFSAYYEDNEQAYAIPRGGNYYSNYPTRVVQVGPSIYQVNAGTYHVQPGAYQAQHGIFDPTRQERQRYSSNYNRATAYGYYPDGSQNSTRRKKYFKSQIVGMRDWYLVKIKMYRTPKVSPESIISTTSGRFPNYLYTWNCNQGIYFFAAPQYFLGNRTASYGGFLKYSLYYTSIEKTHAILDANIIIGGERGYMVHDDLAQPPPFVNWRYRVKMTEENFRRIDGSTLTKRQFMRILSNVTSIYIRASYRSGDFNTRLLNVSLDEIVNGNHYYGAQASWRGPVQHPRTYPRGYRHQAQYATNKSNNIYIQPQANYYVPQEYIAYWSTYYYTNTGILLESADYSMTYYIEGDDGTQLLHGYLPYTCSIF